MSDALPLLPRPNLEQYNELARDLQEACQTNDPTAIRAWAASWIERLPEPPKETSSAARIEQRWRKLVESNDHAKHCALTAAQFFVAQEHGFASWSKFAAHVEALARSDSPVSAFESAADAIVDGDAQTLRILLDAHPELVRERSTREHRSTLLHYVSANGVEDFRQKTPPNIVEITNLLLDAGADVNAESDAYGGGCTAIGLVATSIHPERAGVQIPLLQTLVDRGASFVQPGTGAASRSVVHGCLANGQLESARFFANLGAPVDFESAAALGRLDILKAAFDERQPSREELESAFFNACGYGGVAAAEFLLDQGVDVAACNRDGQTPLHWANYGPHLDVVRLLLERGAPVNVRDDRYRAAPIDMALWTWQNESKESPEPCYEAIALLVRAGARFDPDQWKGSMLDAIAADPRMQAALRGESIAG